MRAELAGITGPGTAVAAGLAGGQMNPLIAAVLMPLSSLTTLGIVIGGGRPGNAASSDALVPAQPVVGDRNPALLAS